MTATAAGRWPSSRAIAVTLAALVLATLIGTAGGARRRLPALARRPAGRLGPGADGRHHRASRPAGRLAPARQPDRLAAAGVVPAVPGRPECGQLQHSSTCSLGSWGVAAGQLAFLLAPLWIAPIALFPLVILLFPDGRLPSRRWRWLVWAAPCAALLVIGFQDVQTIGAVTRHQFRVTAGGTLPAQHWVPGWVSAVLPLLVLVTLATVWLAAIGRQVASWRRSSGERRQQLKWLMSGGVVFGAAVVPSLAAASALWEVAAMAFAALPVSIGVAILRYRLYDIDRLISRTLGYALVTGLLVGVYAGLVLLATQVLGFSSTWAVAASTLVAAALFSPVRRRVQRVVDRRFNRARYDADAAVAAFADRLQARWT